MDVRGVYRPTDEEHEAFLKEVTSFCGDDLPNWNRCQATSKDEHEACRIMTAYDNGDLPADCIAWVASSSDVMGILHCMSEDRLATANLLKTVDSYAHYMSSIEFRILFDNDTVCIPDIAAEFDIQVIELGVGVCKAKAPLRTLDKLLEKVPDLEIFYWEGLNRVTRTSTVMSPPMHTRAAYCQFRTPPMGNKDKDKDTENTPITVNKYKRHWKIPLSVGNDKFELSITETSAGDRLPIRSFTVYLIMLGKDYPQNIKEYASAEIDSEAGDCEILRACIEEILLKLYRHSDVLLKRADHFAKLLYNDGSSVNGYREMRVTNEQ